jgi:hypothetical protein
MTWRIDKPTPEQEADIPRFREHWRAIGLSTEPVSPKAVRRAVCDLYRAGGLPEPKMVVLAASPLRALIARSIVQVSIGGDLGRFRHIQALPRAVHNDLLHDLASQVGERLSRRLNQRLVHGLEGYNRIWIELRGQLAEMTELAGLWASLGDQLDSRKIRWLTLIERELDCYIIRTVKNSSGLEERLHAGPSNTMDAELASELREDTSLFAPTFFMGGQDAFRLALYDFAEHIGARFAPSTKARFEAYKAYVRTCGWMYPYQMMAFVSDRPTEIHLDAQQRLHCATGMAIRYRDGWGLHAWHGLRVPARIVEAKALDVDAVEKEPNAELRRVMLERDYGGRSGFEIYLEARQARVISRDELHGQPRRLLEVDVGGRTMRILEVVNGSLGLDGRRRRFHLGALPGDSPHDVVAASYGINPAIYREAIRT